MSDIKIDHHEEQMEAARQEFDHIWPLLKQHWIGCDGSKDERTLFRVESVCWKAFLNGKCLK